MVPKSIIFFGEDSFSLIVLESLFRNGYKIIKSYSNYYENNIHKRLELFCFQNNIPFERIKNISNKDLWNEVKVFSPDFIIICHFQKILPMEIFNSAKFGALNLHPSLLPKYRGMSPQHWPIIFGDIQTGISIHFVDEKVDIGKIVLQYKVEIGENDYVHDLQEKFKIIYAQIFVDALDGLINGNLMPYMQSEDDISYFGRIKLADCFIRDEYTIEQAYNRIRALSKPYIGARYENLIIWKAEIIKDYELNNFQIGFYEHSELGPILNLKNGFLKLIKYETTDN
jgi:methionyl-tRNA formyltransferase